MVIVILLAEILKRLEKKKPGDKLKFKVLRERNTMEVSVELSEDSAG